MAETLWKKKQHKNYQDEDKKSAINKKINSQNNIGMKIYVFILNLYKNERKLGNPYGVVANVLDCTIRISKFELSLCCYVRANTL